MIQSTSVVSVLLRAAASSTATEPRLDWKAVADKIVERLAPQQGERVVSFCDPGQFRKLLPHLSAALGRAGATDLGCLDIEASPHPSEWGVDVPAGASAKETYKAMFADLDAAIALPGAFPIHAPYAALQDLLRTEPKRMVHFHWDGAGGSAIPIPGGAAPSREAMDALYQQALLETDYDAVADAQRRFASAMRKGEVRVTTPRGTDLRFRIGDRPVTFQDGDASAARAERGVVLIDREIELPCGAIRVAPIEESVYGTIVFPAGQWSSKPAGAVTMRFEAGRIVDYSTDSGLDAVKSEIESVPAAGRYFRELALGFNPLLAIPEKNPWIPYYGYGAGVVRLSLGDNSELGGNVTGGYVRWNFFVDATVAIDGRAWVSAGQLLDELGPAQ